VPTQFDIEVDGKVLVSTVMTGGTPQGSPLSPALLTIYMSSVVWAAEKRLKEGTRKLRRERRDSYWLLSYIDDVDGARVGGEREMGQALEGAL